MVPGIWMQTATVHGKMVLTMHIPSVYRVDTYCWRLERDWIYLYRYHQWEQWYLNWNGNGVWDNGVDKAYNFGALGWIPITGEWWGNGMTKIGVTNGQQWYLTQTATVHGKMALIMHIPSVHPDGHRSLGNGLQCYCFRCREDYTKSISTCPQYSLLFESIKNQDDGISVVRKENINRILD